MTSSSVLSRFYPTPLSVMTSVMALILLVLGLSLTYIQLGTDLPLTRQWQLWSGASPDSFEDYEYVYARLPRWVMVILVGMVMGLTGSLIQQLTRNPLLSPMTLGTSSGAWLSLVIMNIWWPGLVESHGATFAMGGALLSMAMVILIVGWQNLSGLPVVLAGMSVNILLGSLATAIILLNDQYARNLFIWGAGDLSQNGWDSVLWLLPRLVVVAGILVVAPGVLTLLRLGHEAAAARGMNIAVLFLLLMIAGIWLVSSVLTVVGVIGFIGLIAPNIARSLGARTAQAELLVSAGMGVVLLLVSDGLALYLSQFTPELIPSGLTAALIGAPALIWFTYRRSVTQEPLFFSMPGGKQHFTRRRLMVLCLLFGWVLFMSVFVRMMNQGWLLAMPDEFIWSLRWPRIATAFAAGAGMAVAGVIMQRLIHNPLASPDLLGMSAGSVLAVVLAGFWVGQFDTHWGPALAFSGSMLTLFVLLVLSRRKAFSPSVVIMTGIALAALIETLVQFALIKGTDDVYAVIRWLSGSTYNVEASEALFLLGATSLVFGCVMLCHRWLTLISAGRSVALARGLEVNRAFALLLTLAAALCALTTAIMGPVAFVGLLAPHMAAMLGARSVIIQLSVSALLGSFFLMLADWTGQVVIYPAQLSAGTIVSLIGGGYFVFLLMRGRLSQKG